MMALTSYDGVSLAYHLEGAGPGDPIVAIPGGPMVASVSFGDLGGLTEHRRVVRLDLRGTGGSAVPDDLVTYRCDRQVADIEALRVHLGLDKLTLLGHSGGTNLVLSYAARHPEHVESLILVAPSPYGVGIEVTSVHRRAIVALREDEPWFEAASEALGRIMSGQGADADEAAMAPFFYGRWDAAAKAHYELCEELRNADGAAIFGSDHAYDPTVIRAALATLDVPVVVLGGDVDVNSPPHVVAEVAGLFPNATLATRAGVGHSAPWLDDPAWFTETVLSR